MPPNESPSLNDLLHKQAIQEALSNPENKNNHLIFDLIDLTHQHAHERLAAQAFQKADTQELPVMTPELIKDGPDVTIGKVLTRVINGTPIRNVADQIRYDNSQIGKAVKGKYRLPFPIVLKIMDACKANDADRKQLEVLYSSVAA